MASNGRGHIVLIFAAVAVAAGAGGYYFLKVYRPKEALTAARAGVTAWDARYTAARACLLGDKPASSVTREALAVRELLSPADPMERHRCSDLVAKLNRDAANSGIDAVEQAWDALDKAGIAAASAFATHYSAPMASSKDPLPAALDALDAARGKLFAAVELPVPSNTGQPLPRATALAILDEGAPVDQPSSPLTPSAHGLVFNAQSPGHPLQVTLTTGGTPRVDRITPGAMRSPNDGSWGAIVDATGLHVGGFDDNGVLQATSSLALKDGVLAAVGGTRDQGLVVAGNSKQVFLVTVKGGALQALPAIAIDGAGAVADANGDIGMLLSAGASHKLRTWRAGVFHDLALADFDPDADPRMCLTGDGMVEHPFVSLCTADAWLRFHGESMRDVCTPDCRHVALPKGAPYNAATTVIAGKLVALSSHGGVIAMWSEDGSRAFFAIPAGFGDNPSPTAAQLGGGVAMTDGKVIDVLQYTERGLAVVRVPVTAPAH
jgi:hypothetical protein